MRPHVLFNLINQRKPLLLIDFRPAKSFAHCRIRGSCLFLEQQQEPEVEDSHASNHCDSELASNNSSITDRTGCSSSTNRLEKLEKLVGLQVYLKASLYVVCVVEKKICSSDVDDDKSNGEEDSTLASNQQFETLLREFKASAAKHTILGDTDNEEHICSSHWTEKVLSLKSIQFEDFYLLYSECESLFVRGHATTSMPRNDLLTYFPTEILPEFLYLGDYREGTNELALRGLRITHIVDCSGECMSESLARRLNIVYCPISVWDLEGVDIAVHFGTVTEFVQRAKTSLSARVLVHCRAGISRGATFILSYLMQAQVVSSLLEAYRVTLEERPICPNKSFRQQLRNVEMEVFGNASFATDNDNMSAIHRFNNNSVGFFTIESSHDRTPIVTGNVTVDEYPLENNVKETVSKIKKPFLRKGHGTRK